MDDDGLAMLGNLELLAESQEAVAALPVDGAKKWARASPAEQTSEAQVLQLVN